MQIILVAREGKGPDFRPLASLLEANFVWIERSNCSSPPLSYISWGPTFKVVRPLATTRNPRASNGIKSKLLEVHLADSAEIKCLKNFDIIFIILSIAALPALRQKSAEALHRERALFKEILCILKGKTAQECIKGNVFFVISNFKNLRKKINYIYPNIWLSCWCRDII